MKSRIHIAESAHHSIRQTDRNHREKSPLFAEGMVAKAVPQLNAEILAKFFRKPAESEMLLTNQEGLAKRNPSWELVEKTVRELDPGHFNSYACLSIPGSSYIQCLHGFNGYHLEWRITNPSGSYVHFRGCYPGGSKKNV